MGAYGKRLKELREKKRLSQKELSAFLGISAATISRYEKNQIIPTEEVIVKTALFFKTSTDYLLGLCPSPHVQKSLIKEYETVKVKAGKYDALIKLIKENMK